MSGYRRPAEVPDYSTPKEVTVSKKEPWSTWAVCMCVMAACVVGLDLSLVVAAWGQLTAQSVAAAAAVHFGLGALVVPLSIAMRDG